jgi:hypothetical protein
VVPPAFAPSAFGTSPKFERGVLCANPNYSNVEFGGGWVGALECAVTGASRLSYNSVRRLFLREQPDEVDFAVCPTASH